MLDFYPPSASEILQNEIATQRRSRTPSSTQHLVNSPQPNDFEQRCSDALTIAQMLVDFADLHDLPQPYQKSLSKLVGILKGELIS